MKFVIFRTSCPAYLAQGRKPYTGAVWDEVNRVWTIEIESIEQVLAMSPVVIEMNDDHAMPEIEIYDGYRE